MNISVVGDAFAKKSSLSMKVGGDLSDWAQVEVCTDDAIVMLSDLLSDAYDAVTEEQWSRLLDLAGEIQSCHMLKEAEKICMNCDDPRACVNCENFAKIHGQ